MSKASRKTNKTRHPLYITWAHMRQRCYNKNYIRYQDHGGRGILVCASWLNSFEKFCEDMGPRPSPNHSVERINNDGNYTPSNCRWATPLEQMHNRRDNTMVEFNGRKQVLAKLAHEFGIPHNKVRARVLRYGWDVHTALTTP